MIDIFISYKREDLEKVRPLAETLEEKGWSVWWDPKLRGGKPFSQDIEKALSEARSVIVVWSNKSIDSYWVAAEATKGLERKILVAVNIESGVEPPVPFNIIHSNPLIDWNGTIPSTQFDKIAKDLESILGPPPLKSKNAEKKLDESKLTTTATTESKSPTPRKRSNALKLSALASIGALLTLAIVAWFVWWNRTNDLSQWVRIRDSATEGTVAGLAVVTAMEARLAQQKRPVSLSARYVYEKAKSLEQFGPETEGTDIKAALYVAETYGAPPEDSWPYIAGSRDLPEGKTWTALDKAASKFRAKVFRLSHYREVPTRLKQGQPVLAETRVTPEWTSAEPTKTGLVRLGENETFLGNHVVVIVDFDPADSSIKFANSWGHEWGAHGFGKMSAEDAHRALGAMWAIDVPFVGP